MLELRGIDLAIGSVAILRKVDLTLAAGQMAGLIGRNGAGKTTLMRSIMGLLAPTRGSIAFAGRDLVTVPGYERSRMGIGYMPEDRRLVLELTAEENVLLPACASRVADAPQRLKRIYAMVPEVEALSSRKAVQLSGGQQKLVALARALMCGRRLLLLDEPFEGVAPALSRRLAEVIRALRGEGLSVIVSESDLQHSRGMLDIVYRIDRGVVMRAPESVPQ